MSELVDTVVGLIDETKFSGVVRVDDAAGMFVVGAYGMADRRHAIGNTTTTRFALASGTKGLTALTVMRLVELGTLGLSTSARSILGRDLPLVDDGVTIEHLLAHRSGIGDYLDEDIGGDITDYAMAVPVHRLAATEDYVAALDGYPAKFAPGAEFSYSNAGYVVLALIAERVCATDFHELVDRLVCAPGVMANTAFLRSDELPGNTAVGYLAADGLRTNALHLPVRGSGDGGIYSTLDDMHALWAAVFDGRIVAPTTLAEMIRPRSRTPSGAHRYGLGFWLGGADDSVQLEGYDAGVSFRSVCHPNLGRTYTVISNTSEGAWPVANLLDEQFIA